MLVFIGLGIEKKKNTRNSCKKLENIKRKQNEKMFDVP